MIRHDAWTAVAHNNLAGQGYLLLALCQNRAHHQHPCSVCQLSNVALVQPDTDAFGSRRALIQI